MRISKKTMQNWTEKTMLTLLCYNLWDTCKLWLQVTM
jgi:hypothetical protein